MPRHSLIISLTAFFAYLFADTLIHHMPLDFIVTIICAAAALAIWLRVRVWKEADAGPVPLSRVLTFYWFAFGVTVAFSISLEQSFQQFALLTIAMTVYGTTVYLARAWPPQTFLSALRNASWLLIAVVAFIMLFSAATGGDLRPPAPNTLAAVFNLLLLPSLVEFVERPRRSLAIWIVAALALILVTQSRGGWFGLAAGLLTLAVHQRSRLAAWGAWARRFWPVAVPMGAIAIIWQIVRPDHSIRLEFWIVAAAAFVARPLVGIGPGTFGIVWSYLYSTGFQAMHAHSIIFTTIAEQGIVGLFALAVVAVAVMRASWRDAGLLAAVVAFSAHSLVDSLNVAPAVVIVLAVLLGSRLAIGGQNEHQ